MTRRQHGMLFQQATQGEHPRDISHFTTEELLAIIAQRNASQETNTNLKQVLLREHPVPWVRPVVYEFRARYQQQISYRRPP